MRFAAGQVRAAHGQGNARAEMGRVSQGVPLSDWTRTPYRPLIEFAYERVETNTTLAIAGTKKFVTAAAFNAWLDEQNRISETIGSPWRYQRKCT